VIGQKARLHRGQVTDSMIETTRTREAGVGDVVQARWVWGSHTAIGEAPRFCQVK